MKKRYLTPELLISELEMQDIVTASGEVNGLEDFESGDGDSSSLGSLFPGVSF